MRVACTASKELADAIGIILEVNDRNSWQEGKLMIVGLVGSLRAGSSTSVLVSSFLDECRRRGAAVEIFAGDTMNLPQYDPAKPLRDEAAIIVDAIRRCDALVLGSPAYHGGISGTMKVALDYLEDLRTDRRIYLAGRPVASIVTGAGWQGVASTLGHMRDIVHALRGWNVPLGATVNVAETRIAADGKLPDQIVEKFSLMVDDLMAFRNISAPLRRLTA